VSAVYIIITFITPKWQHNVNKVHTYTVHSISILQGKDVNWLHFTIQV